MKPRIAVNLAFFALLGVVMTVWAFTSVIELDALTRPYRVSAEFTSSPGLVPGFDVAYLGVRVGKIGDVRLAPGEIVTGLDIDRDVRLPRDVTAEVRRKSAVGEPYVELSPPASGAGGGTLAAGDVIPLSRTSVPPGYRRLFDGVGRLLRAVPPEDAHTIVHELATGLDGREGSVRDVIDDAHDLTGTLARSSGLLDDLSAQLTRLTGTLASKRGELATGLADLHEVTASLRRSREDLNAFLDRAPGTLRRIDRLLRASRPGLSCALTALGTHNGIVFTRRNERYIRHVLGVVPTALALMDDVGDVRPEGTYARAAFIFSVPGGPREPEEYRRPIRPPAVPPLRHCPEPQSPKPSSPQNPRVPKTPESPKPPVPEAPRRREP
ncbi:MCE family protein [Planotetraspora sp. A-T 1434]|uniref:MCE family protein n=1 Tax=Planotetraspora sp. A-T 1434 TaxID=2979219 RepID=UPI0021C19678|nr:MCE family protein [Planotetraspora sp. A-T 1434]MCT9930494.1 MCE family protein [Planotetraspora sp. A-T 1434]